jgi:SHS2 domain-containing protein
MKKYEQIDISGDVGLRISGRTLEELFENAAEGLFELITDQTKITEKEMREVHVVADNNESLLVQWLNELIFIFDAYNMVGKSFKVSIHGNSLKAEISAGIFDPVMSESRLLIKAATYHNISLKQVNSLWRAEVIFDI